MEAAAGFEPAHKGFADLPLSHLGTPPEKTRIRSPGFGTCLNYSTNPCSLNPDPLFYGAGDEIRTRDPNLGKVVLYH